MSVVWQCSVTCDEGIQQRQVVCKASDNTIGECEGEKPETVLICKLSPCPGEYVITELRASYTVIAWIAGIDSILKRSDRNWLKKKVFPASRHL